MQLWLCFVCNFSTHMTGIIDDTHFKAGPVQSDSELWINAGRAYAVPIAIGNTGARLMWEFTTYPKVTQYTHYVVDEACAYVWCRLWLHTVKRANFTSVGGVTTDSFKAMCMCGC